jgi:hypothetical protein
MTDPGPVITSLVTRVLGGARRRLRCSAIIRLPGSATASWSGSGYGQTQQKRMPCCAQSWPGGLYRFKTNRMASDLELVRSANAAR